MKINILFVTSILLILAGIVWAVTPDGAALYDSKCAGCHGPLAVSGKKGATAAGIRAAITGNIGGMDSLSSLTTDEVQAVSLALAPPNVYDATNFTVDGRKWQPAPTGYLVGKDNGTGDGFHNPGDDCGICHTLGGKAGNKVWTMSGTVYDSRAARTTLANAEVVFQNISGQVISVTTNEVGNFWTDKPFFSNQPDRSDSANWRYKVWVKSGANVRPMISLAAVGSSSGSNPRMSCSMHHAGLGSRGGLWVLPASTLSSYPATALSYRKHIFPILRSKCAPCHIPAVSTAVAAASEAAFDYSNGLDLVTYAGSTVSGVTKRGVQSVVNISEPSKSLLLAKTLNGSAHGGGSFWSGQDADYKALLQWIKEGAKDDRPAGAASGGSTGVAPGEHLH